MPKISELNPLGAAPEVDDLLAIVDTSAVETKNMTLIDIREGLSDLKAAGAIYVLTPAPVTLPNDTVEAVIGGITALQAGAINFDMPQNGRIRYLGDTSIRVHIDASLSAISSRSGIVLTAMFGKNGTVLDPSKIDRKISTGGDVGAMSLNWFVDLDTNDFVELLVSQDNSNSSDITANRMTMTVATI